MSRRDPDPAPCLSPPHSPWAPLGQVQAQVLEHLMGEVGSASRSPCP